MKLGELLESHGWARVEQGDGKHPKWRKDGEVLEADKAQERVWEAMRKNPIIFSNNSEIFDEKRTHNRP